MATSRAIVDALAGDTSPHYGISTGFGALATTSIAPARRAALQASLIRSHAAGTGTPVETEVVRAMMLLRLSTLATGRTGIRPATAEAYAALLNAGITPIVPEYGSLGCSGDLAPLATVALALIGEGEVIDSRGRRRPAADALAEAGLTPVVLAEKEGLALINGTDGMLGMLVLALADLDALLDAADLAAAMSVEALLGTDRVFAPELQALRPQTGQAISAARMFAALAGSAIVASHAGPERHPRPGRLLAALLTGGARHRPRYRRPRHDDRRSRVGQRHRQSRRADGRPGGVERQFPRRADRRGAGFPGDLGRRRRGHRRAAHRPDAGHVPLARPAAVPRARGGRRFRADDRAVHPGRDRLRTQATGGAGVGRFHPVLGHAGGSRLDGLARRAQAAPRRGRAPPGAGHRDAHRGKGSGSPGAARARRRSPVRSATWSAPRWPGPARTGTSPPRSTPWSTFSPPVRSPLAANDQIARRTNQPTARTVRHRTSTVHRQGEPMTTATSQPAGPRPVRAATGTSLTAKSWATEAPLRMLCNNLDPDVAEDPDNLVVYGGTGKAARDWRSFDAICRSLTDLEQDETLLVQSGRPVGVLRTHEWAPRVLIANSNLVGDWANWPEFRRLEALGLTMYGQMTAGSWIYIGSQGIVQGTYETFAAVAEKLAAARPRRQHRDPGWPAP